MSRLKFPLPTFIGLATLSALIYFFVFSRFSLRTFYSSIPPVDYAKLTHHSTGGIIAFVFGILVLFGIYLWMIKQPLPKFAPYGGVIFSIILFFSYPVLAIDLFVYAIRSRGWVLYGLNPLATAPAAFPAGDPWLKLAAEWASTASPYGVLWEWLSAQAYHLSNGDFLTHLFVLKGIAILSYVISIILIGKILAILKPEWKVAAQFAFAWNPLILLETAQNAHNDMLMVAILLAAVWAMLAGRDGWVMPLLAMSVLVKFITILALPFFVWYLLKKMPTRFHQISAGGWYLLVFSVIVIIPMAFVFPGWDAWVPLKAGSSAGRSLLATLVLALEGWLGTNPAFAAGRYLVNGLWLAIVGTTTWHYRHNFQHPQTPILLAWAALFGYAMLAAPVFHAWYLLWSLPLAIVLGTNSIAFRVSVVASAAALLAIPYFETVRVWYPVLLQNALLGHFFGMVILLLPPLWVLSESFDFSKTKT